MSLRSKVTNVVSSSTTSPPATSSSLKTQGQDASIIDHPISSILPSSSSQSTAISQVTDPSEKAVQEGVSKGVEAALSLVSVHSKQVILNLETKVKARIARIPPLLFDDHPSPFLYKPYVTEKNYSLVKGDEISSHYQTRYIDHEYHKDAAQARLIWITPKEFSSTPSSDSGTVSL